MTTVLQQIRQELLANASPERVEKMKVIIPGSLPAFGVINPVINDMAKRYKSFGIPLVVALWETGFYEEQLLSAKILVRIAKKNVPESIQLLERFSGQLSDWSVCDTLVTGLTKALAKSHTDYFFDLSAQLIDSPNFWERRVSLVLLQHFCKQKNFHPEIARRVMLLKADKTHYVKKAVDWIIRDLKKNGYSL
jgi:3-methyladenine DNA glycosylase AlkD